MKREIMLIDVFKALEAGKPTYVKFEKELLPIRISTLGCFLEVVWGTNSFHEPHWTILTINKTRVEKPVFVVEESEGEKSNG